MSTKKPSTAKEAADRLGVSHYAIYAWIRQGRLGYLRLGRAIRIPEAEIKRVLTSGYQAARRVLGGNS